MMNQRETEYRKTTLEKENHRDGPPRKGNRRKAGNRKRSVLIAVLCAALLGESLFVGANWDRWFGDQTGKEGVETGAEQYTGDRETYTGKKNTDTIDIPGFDVMNVQAGVTEQKVNLHNPEQNTCYFKMTILLNDGTKLWESGLVEPGKAVYDLTFSKPLEAGEYEGCTLKYECFAMDEAQTPLNGSEITFTMNALE